MSHTRSAALWRNSDLRSVLIGETISDLGSQLGDLALPLIATLALRVSAGEMAVLLAAEYVPRVVVGLLAASWIDRVRRRPVLIMTNLARGVILAAVAFAASRDALTIELLYGVATALAAMDVVFAATFAAYLPSLIPASALVTANSARATSSAGAGVLGPAVAGVLISGLGAPLAILADALSFIVSAMGIGLVRASETQMQSRFSP